MNELRARPVILILDPVADAHLSEELHRRYGTDYRIECVHTIQDAQAEMRRLRETDQRLAILLADRSVTECDAVFEEALKLGEAEAREYSRSARYRNRYGQKVRSRYLGCCDAYEIGEIPISGVEVFSETEIVPRRVADRTVIRRLIGEREQPRQGHQRKNILDIVFAAPAPGVRLTRAELAFVTRHGTLKRRDA